MKFLCKQEQLIFFFSGPLGGIFQLACIHIGSFAQDLDHKLFFFNQELKLFDTAICALHLKAPHAVTRASLSSFGHRVNWAVSLLGLGNWAVSSTLPYGTIFLLHHIRQCSVLAYFKPFNCWWETWGSLSLSKVMCLSHSSAWLYSVVFFLLGNCEVILLQI